MTHLSCGPAAYVRYLSLFFREPDHNRLLQRDYSEVSFYKPKMYLSARHTFEVPQWRIENT